MGGLRCTPCVLYRSCREFLPSWGASPYIGSPAPANIDVSDVDSDAIIIDDDCDTVASTCDTFGEVYSQPRISPLVDKCEGHSARMSVDLRYRGGERDLGRSAERWKVMKDLKKLEPRLLAVSPPCTMYR